MKDDFFQYLAVVKFLQVYPTSEEGFATFRCLGCGVFHRENSVIISSWKFCPTCGGVLHWEYQDFSNRRKRYHRNGPGCWSTLGADGPRHYAHVPCFRIRAMSRWDDDLPGQWEIETTYPDYAPHAFIKSPWLEVKEKEKGSGRYSKYKIELVPSEPLPLP